MDRITLNIDGQEHHFPKGVRLAEIAQMVQDRYPYPIMVAMVDHELKNCSDRIHQDAMVSFLDAGSSIGARVYQRSLTFLLAKAVHDVFPGAYLHAEHSISNGLYCEIRNFRHLRQTDVEELETRMQQLVEEDLPFVRTTLKKEEALRIFEEQGKTPRVILFEKDRAKEDTSVYTLDGYTDYMFGYLVASTGMLKTFGLRFYMPGFILLFPDEKNPHEMPEFVEQAKLFNVLRETDRFCRLHKVHNVGMLNRMIRSGQAGELIRVSEGLHEKQLIGIADRIAAEKERIRLIMISGPSSSGKTTFAKRLSVQLKVNGISPVSISLDDYFVNRTDTPLDEDGKPDYESLDAIDVEMFNRDLAALLQGDPVELPVFDFRDGVRRPSGKITQISEDQPIVIEGIHGLNDRLTAGIPRTRKFYIYISALTQLNLDSANRIKTTDARLLRRMVRDAQFRGYPADTTLEMWPSVRRGENNNIFPFQENADVMFNSHLVYELAVLKAFAEPLLRNIPVDAHYHADAKNLLNILDFFEPLEDLTDIPNNSIIREFIGESCFDKGDH